MKNRKIYLIIVLFFAFFASNAQNDLTYYHLGSTTPQSHIYNPVFFPNARFYVSLPAMSGVHASVNGALTWNEVFTKIDGTKNLLVDPKNVLSHINEGDRLNAEALISVLQIGMRLGSKSRVNLFVDERVSTSIYYPKSLISYLMAGNASEANLGQVNSDKNIKAEAIYYREYGLGYARDFLLSNEKKLSVGLKVKYLQGMGNLQVQPGASYSLATNNDDFHISASTSNFKLNTVGTELDISKSPEYLLANSNNGLGFDLGAQLNWSDKLSFSLAINDIGRINWKEQVKNYSIDDTQVEFGGLDLKDLSKPGNVLEDTLNVLFPILEDTLSYHTYLNPRVFMSANYKVIKNGTVSGSILARKELGRPVYMFGLGYNQQVGKILTVTATVSSGTNKSLNWGGGFAARFGVVQIYSTVENTLGKFDIRNTERMGVRLGINFLFGRTEKKVKVDKKANQTNPEKVKKTKPSKLSPFPPQYDLDHLIDL